jgi:hypothetical protein
VQSKGSVVTSHVAVSPGGAGYWVGSAGAVIEPLVQCGSCLYGGAREASTRERGEGRNEEVGGRVATLSGNATGRRCACQALPQPCHSSTVNKAPVYVVRRRVVSDRASIGGLEQKEVCSCGFWLVREHATALSCSFTRRCGTTSVKGTAGGAVGSRGSVCTCLKHLQHTPALCSNYNDVKCALSCIGPWLVEKML